MQDVGGIGRLASAETRAALSFLDQLRQADTETHARLRAESAAQRLQRVLDAKRQRPEYLTLDYTTGPAATVIPKTLSTDTRIGRPVDLFAAGAVQVTAAGITAQNFHIDLRHSRDERSFFVSGEVAIEGGQLFDLFDWASSLYTPLREWARPVTLEVGQSLTLDLYHDITTAAAVRTLVIMAGRSIWPANADEGMLGARDLARVRELIAQSDRPVAREVVATFAWTNPGAQGATAEFRSPALNDPVLVRGLYAPSANFTTINNLRVGKAGLPFMSTAIPLRLIAQAAVGSKTSSLVHGLELPVPVFLPPGERLYADLVNSISGDGAGADFDADDAPHRLIKLIVETP